MSNRTLSYSTVSQSRTGADKTVSKRTTITFSLSAGPDDDLIRWLSAIPERERSRAIRDRLRGNKATGDGSGLDSIRSDLAELRELIMRGNFSPSAGEQPAVEAAPRLSPDEVAARAEKMKKAKW